MKDEEEFPKIGHLYLHRNGQHYRLLLIGREEGSLRDAAIYQSLESGQVWIRPLDQFCPPRFTPVS